MELEKNSRGARILWWFKIGSLCEGLELKIIEMSGI